MGLADYTFTALAVDTNIYINEGFDFEGKKLGLLKQYLDSDVQILIPKIFYTEMLHHYKKKCRQEKSVALKGINSLSHFWKLVDNPSEMKKIVFDKKYPEKKLNEFIRSTGAKLVSGKGVDVDRINTMYQDFTPPFANNEKKRKEFPDAIALLSLEQWAEEEGGVVLLVTKDKGMREFCETSEYVKTIPELTDAYAHFLHDDELFQDHLLENISDLNLEEAIREKLSDYIEFNSFEPEGESYFYFELNDCSAEFKSYYMDDTSVQVIDISPDEIIIEVSGEVDYTAHAEFDLYQEDSIDKDYMKVGKTSQSLDKTEPVQVIITLDRNDSNEVSNLDIFDMEFSSLMQDIYFGDLEPDWIHEPDPSELDYVD